MPSPLHPTLPTSPGDRRRWGTLHGAAGSLALASTARQHPGLLLVVTTGTAAAFQVEQELRFFLGADAQAQDDSPARIPVLGFPDWETLAYDSFSPHEDIISQRLATLAALPKTRRGVLVVPVPTLLHRVVPTTYLASHGLQLAIGDTFDVVDKRRQLEAAGYRCVDTVMQHGEFAVRGALLDLFPMGSDLPYRVDLFDDEIETLRTFDPETQLTLDKVERVDLLPAKEFPLDQAGISRFRNRWHTTFEVDVRRASVYQDVSAGIVPAGAEYYLPLFFDGLATLFDYLPGDTLAATIGDVGNAAEQFRQGVDERYENLRWDTERPILAPAELFLAVDEMHGALGARPRVEISEAAVSDGAGRDNFNTDALPNVAADSRAQTPTAALEGFLVAQDVRVLFCAESAGRREVVRDLLAKAKIGPEMLPGFDAFAAGDADLGLTVAAIDRPLYLPGFDGQQALAVVTEAQLFGGRVLQSRRRGKATDADAVVRNLTELSIGAPVVHIDNGVGRYLGLEVLEAGGAREEYLTLEYADGAKLYVPVHNLHMVQRYTGGDEDSAPIHRLGSDQWEKARRKAAEKVRDVAAELLNIYARRAARPGRACSPPDADYERFCAQFPFEETPDQAQAIQAVIKDMVAPSPMDRLVCGDVGFGKTEVAMRAAWMAVASGRQVAMLVPTTLLAQQHFDDFCDRFADWPVRIALLSRFRSGKEARNTDEDVGTGNVDILIGTHKLLHDKDLKFKNLGLLIIDEEHRFGVRHKEKLKSLRSEVDILTLTATPIPRTLNMSMSGMRDMSIIATPPARRLSIKTFVRQGADGLVKEAILRELMRGGQVYMVHNRVETIEQRAREVAELVPDARIAIGHGQMRERQLEQVMSDFYHRRANVLVCSTIIETGIDVPNANTIIIDRADRFGLAQLHQLRGRVGRSHHQAYAWLLTPHPKAMSTDARKRLEAIEAAGELGAGFTLATHDLEIRGAGELLGDEQSGQIQTIGFSLYMQMLNQAVKAIQRGETPNLDKPLDDGVEVNMRCPALIPDDYLPDVHARLIMYKRIANAATVPELEDLMVEMIDRFGLLPDATKALFRLTELKLNAVTLGITKIDVGPEGGRIEFGERTKVDPFKLVQLVQARPNECMLDAGGSTLRIKRALADTEQRFNAITRLLERLQPEDGLKASA